MSGECKRCGNHTLECTCAGARTDMSDVKQMKPCPFCGGEPKRVDIETAGQWEDPNAGGSFIECSKCQASSAIEFNYKETLYERWNDRTALSGTREAVEPVAKSRVDWPAEITNCPFCNAANVYLCKPWKDARHRVECNMCRASGPVKTSAQAAVDAWAFFAQAAPPSDPVGQGAVTVKPLDNDQIMEIIKEVAPWKTEPALNDLLTYEKSPPLFPQATYDVPSYRAERFVRAVERRILSALSPAPEAEFPQPDQNRRGKEPCGECRIQPGETCDICGASPAPEAGSDEVERLRARNSELELLVDGDGCVDPDKIDALFRRAETAETKLSALREKLGEMREATIDVTASLAAAISLLERSPKKAAASDKMFDQMLADYRSSLTRTRATLANTDKEAGR